MTWRLTASGNSTFLTSALDRGGWSASRSNTHCIWGWMGCRAGLDAVKYRESNVDRLVRSPSIYRLSYRSSTGILKQLITVLFYRFRYSHFPEWHHSRNKSGNKSIECDANYVKRKNWVFGPFPLSGILETRKHDVSESSSLSVLRWGGKSLDQCSRLALSKEPN
jgi:hypothetical protein